MREQLIQYVDLLFAGAQNCEDIKQEILQNTLDRYDDLIAEGKVPEAAYRLAISGIGDINEILGIRSNPIPESSNHTAPVEMPENDTPLKKLLRAIAVGLYIISFLPLFLLSGMGMETIGLCGTLCIVAVATVLIILGGKKDEGNDPHASESVPLSGSKPLKQSIGGLIWAIGLLLYFIISFTTSAWYITWVIFLIIPAVQGLADAIADLKGGSSTNAIIRIILFSITVVLLLGILVGGISYRSLNENFRHTEGSGEAVAGPVAVDDSVSMAAVNSENIEKIEIDWVSGSIRIQPGDETDTIRFWDNYTGDDQYILHYTVSGSTLKIQFCEEPIVDFGFHFSNPLRKDLVVTVPTDWNFSELEVDAASAKLEVHDLQIGQVNLDTASGAVGFENCHVDTLDIDTASGDVIFSGTLRQLDCDGASASIVAYLSNVPRTMDIDTASGNLDITLPENAGFTVDLDALSGKFNSDFDYNTANDRYISGDGSCRISVSSMSGNVTIRKNPNVTSAEVTIP